MHVMVLKSLCFGMVVWFSSNPTEAADMAQLKQQKPSPLVTSLRKPWALSALPDGRILIGERHGVLRLLSPQALAKGVASQQLQDTQSVPLSLPEFIEIGQGGLLDVVAAPDFAQSQRLFVSYSCGTASANHTCLVVGQLKQADGELRFENVTRIFQSQPAKSGGAHFSGRIVWLPDETLVLSVGDGFDYREQAQQLDSHLGKTLRLHQDGSVPDDNPFVDRAGARGEIYTYGHRNSQGLVWDARAQKLIAHEHGPRGGDELNVLVAGANYGWPIATYGLDYTGARVSPFQHLDGVKPPLLEWSPSIAPSAMAIVDDQLIITALASRDIRLLRLPGKGQAQQPSQETLLADLNLRWRNVLVTQQGQVLLLGDGEHAKLYYWGNISND